MIWNRTDELRTPNCYKTGNWDGKMSDPLLLDMGNEYYLPGRAYHVIGDGSDRITFYTHDDYEIHDKVLRWAVIPDESERELETVHFNCFYDTVEACAKEWGIDFKGKDSKKNYPAMPIINPVRR